MPSHEDCETDINTACEETGASYNFYRFSKLANASEDKEPRRSSTLGKPVAHAYGALRQPGPCIRTGHPGLVVCFVRRPKTRQSELQGACDMGRDNGCCEVRSVYSEFLDGFRHKAVTNNSGHRQGGRKIRHSRFWVICGIRGLDFHPWFG